MQVPSLLRKSALGLLDALAAPHGADRYLDLVRPDWSRREVRATVVDVRHPSADTVTVTLAPNARWEGFSAGQFVNLTVEVDGVRRTRCYSPASSAHGPLDRLELTAKVHPDGVVSPHLHRRLRRGDVVNLSQAQGTFTLPFPRPPQILLLSAGTGITPVLSMLRTLCDEQHARPVTFVHYAPSPFHALYRDEVAALARAHPNVRVLTTATDTTGADLVGLFNDEHLHRLAPRPRAVTAFACGPGGFLESVRQSFTAAGAADRLHVEEFTPPPPPARIAECAAGTVSFTTSGLQATSSGETLLELAEAQGLRPPSGCRMGICHTCVTPMPSGAVRDVRTGRVCDEPGSRVQLCVSVPVADTELTL